MMAPAEGRESYDTGWCASPAPGRTAAMAKSPSDVFAQAIPGYAMNSAVVWFGG